ncbi:hypothetical protein [Sediminibacterium ginsengisoli]|uniref:Uncharacterized protein n=1 Tax=Sediminibacterium ginsengisoli TaxID=413434 RepID=A0A1T4M7E0_9BACT|nr:hypothetical protein [Sediminibacterium ginsengisoli]SJZ62940.1 hypothetical protein SAMN04488132_103227 [Sediminibacterium ginsengisoli]
MKFLALFTITLLVGLSPVWSQSAASVRDWPMPEGHRTGLSTPGFKVVPTLSFENLGSEKHLVLKMDITMGTAQNPVAPFSYHYTYNGKEYTDRDLGFDPFASVRMQKASFSVLVQGPGVNQEVLYESVISRKDLGVVSKDAVLSTYSCHVQSLRNVYYSGTEPVETAIRNFEEKRKSQNQAPPQVAKPPVTGSSAPAITSEPVQNRATTANTASSGASQPRPVPEQNKTSSNTAAKDDFWNEKKPVQDNTKTLAQPGGKVIPEQPNHKNLPDFVRTTDGGYFHRGADGKFREVSAEEYQKAKSAVATSNTTPVKEEQKMTAAEVRAAVDKMFSDARDRDAAINARINQFSQAMQQNFYYAEAIRNGKQNLAELSTLSGNYNSIEQLEAEFNQKYSSIRSEVQGIEQARNAKLNNAVNANFNGSSTEQAIGQGVALIGSIFNSAKASKEEKEAREALKAERERQQKALIAAKQKARNDLRNQLLKSFPNGGTPLTAHKVTQPQVYMFGYIVDQATLNNEAADVTVSNVFPVAQYSDGTYPFKTVVSGKLNGLSKGDVMLVGFYTDKNAAEQMRKSFIGLAQKSELTVKQVTLKPVGSNNGTAATPADFWETGKQPVKAATDTTKKKSDFWNN